MQSFHPNFILCLLFSILSITGASQGVNVSGRVVTNGAPVEFAVVGIAASGKAAIADSSGFFVLRNIAPGSYSLKVSGIGYFSIEKKVVVEANDLRGLMFELVPLENELNEVVVTGTMKEVSRMESCVPVEIYTPTYFRKNPTSSIFDALQIVNGVRPQINCNVCNTGDIHINGLEGPYTMVLIDGMPIVSSLATVYGLSGIPNSLIEKIEVVKGPASSLYGSEAVGGLINVITKNAASSPRIGLDVFGTSWGELNSDAGFVIRLNKRVSVLNGVNHFHFGNVVDKNSDGFTDVALQERISIFQKWNIERKNKRIFSVAGRFLNENRWGGDTMWNESFRGGDSIYGESILTRRWEVLGNYQLPVKEKIILSFSFNDHRQDSRYGTVSYIAGQRIIFSQLTWDKTYRAHDFLVGAALRHTFYDDNTPATAYNQFSQSENFPQITWLPGVFVQDEITLSEKHKLLMGFRYDYNERHGNIYTPRMAYKWTISGKSLIRLNAGTGYRVVNLFTEDHAALTGARQVVIKNTLKPEQSYNVNLNFIRKTSTGKNVFIVLDAGIFYTRFSNRIIADFESDPNKIIYDNLNGYAVSRGVNANVDLVFSGGLKIIAGATWMDVSSVVNDKKSQQLLTEQFSGVWAISYKIRKMNLAIDYTGNLYSPMRLPLLSETDPRTEYSPWWSIQNIQLVYSGWKNVEIYAGVKNLLNWTPNKGNPFIIARSNDPFDKQVLFSPEGQVLSTANNPYALTFDPNYVYGPNQGIRGFAGIRVTIPGKSKLL